MSAPFHCNVVIGIPLEALFSVLVSSLLGILCCVLYYGVTRLGERHLAGDREPGSLHTRIKHLLHLILSLYAIEYIQGPATKLELLRFLSKFCFLRDKMSENVNKSYIKLFNTSFSKTLLNKITLSFL